MHKGWWFVLGVGAGLVISTIFVNVFGNPIISLPHISGGGVGLAPVNTDSAGL